MKTWDEFDLVIEGKLDYKFPLMYKIKQECRFRPINDVRKDLTEKIIQTKSYEMIKPKSRIAITVGSRGIDQLKTVIGTIVEKIKEQNADPFIVPAMGSHGGGDAIAQQKILASYGITEEQVGAPIISSMKVVEIGRLRDGTPLYCDQTAYMADGIIIVNRIKPHTSFRGEIESGLTKMMTIGLGKHKGATAFHQKGFESMGEMLTQAAPIYLKNAPITMGVALIENSIDKLSKLEVVEPNEWFKKEIDLLQNAWQRMPELPVNTIDVLVIDEMGKNISGAGMDPNIINRAGSPAFTPAPAPNINKIVVLDLTDESDGNAIGVGVADLITRRLVDKINLNDMYANAFTSTVLTGSRIPIPIKNDRDAIALAVKTSNKTQKINLVHIKNTLEISELWVSEDCLSEINEKRGVSILKESKIQFDDNGNLLNYE
ncbi:DUF2088 domain-containing protein [Salibacterium salarium]|uniref:DUF2088 domain-containing protein n=1 Tax=Salibacterium salarium TaxID=284579 RepID=A0A428N5M4_9BACI|nr:lactate racemase domain-containing protein [Salibacterium salarium]RSL33608.1 DUF2088 domain-containing protein [Salibacterium salarium]